MPLPWTRRVLAHLGAWVVDILAPEQHYKEAQPCQPDHKQAWREYHCDTVHSDGGGDKGNRPNDEENGQNVHSSILRFFEILLELASSWPESSLVGGLTFGL